MDKPVYELLRGRNYDEIPCHMMGNDLDWAVGLGFTGVKLA